MNDVWVKVIASLIGIAISLVSAYAVPYLKTKISYQTQQNIKFWTDSAVECAEMLFKGSHRGEEKKDYVLKTITNIFNAKKEVITEDQVRVLLEAAVKAMNESKSSVDTKQVAENE